MDAPKKEEALPAMTDDNTVRAAGLPYEYREDQVKHSSTESVRSWSFAFPSGKTAAAARATPTSSSRLLHQPRKAARCGGKGLVAMDQDRKVAPSPLPVTTLLRESQRGAMPAWPSNLELGH